MLSNSNANLKQYYIYYVVTKFIRQKGKQADTQKKPKAVYTKRSEHLERKAPAFFATFV